MVEADYDYCTGNDARLAVGLGYPWCCCEEALPNKFSKKLLGNDVMQAIFSTSIQGGVGIRFFYVSHL